MTREPLTTRSPAERVASEPADLRLIPALTARRIAFEISLINAFEHRVMELKAADCVWGPIHISIGQEATAASCMAALRPGDQVTGSHRAHHVALSKIMEHVLPAAWDPTEDALPPEAADAVYRTLAEIMGLAPGWCGGRGGSMHLRHREAGVLGTNAIVAGGVPLSVGAAFANARLGRDAVVVAFLGDGAVNQGAFHEACNIASIWNLPVVFAVENNQYAVATSVHDATAAGELVELASAYEMPASQALGYDVPALYTAFGEAAARAREGRGPSLVEVKGYRHYHHGGDLKGSRYGYRGADEENEWLARDAFATYPQALVEAGVIGPGQTDAIRALARDAVEAAVRRCTVGDPPSVRAELWPAADTVGTGIRSDTAELAALRRAERDAFPSFTPVKYSDAIALVTGRWLERDATTVVLGEEVANFGGGAYGATKDLPARYPERVINTPISEGGFCGVGLGAAMNGMRPVVEIMFPDFTLVAADQVFNQIGKARHMYGGTTDLPLVLRTRVATGCGYGGQHSMDPVGLYALFAGWRIVAPSDAFEYVGLFNTAMRSLDPVLVLEHHALYAQAGDLPVGADGPDLDYCIPFGRARVARTGTDMTVATYSSMVGRVTGVANRLANEGIEIEVIDLRSVDLASIDYATLGESVSRTGVFATVEQAARGQSIGERIAATVTERFFDELDAPPGVLTAMDVPNPVSRVLEAAAMLDDDEIERTLRDMALRRWR